MEQNLGWISMKQNNITILYVEDEPNARKLLSGFIKRFCKNLYIAQNGEEGLEIYKKHAIDIVISDIKMPKLNGIDMAEAIKKIDKNQLVIFTTAHIDSEYLFKAIELQVDGYVSKPVDLDKLKLQIEKCLVEINAKNIQKKLKESEERARTILETSQLGIVIYKEKILYANDVFLKMIGYTREEICNLAPWDLATKEERESSYKIAKRRLKGERFPLIYNDIVLICKDGSPITCRVNTQTIQYEGGYAGLATVTDITDILYVQERLKQLAQAMEQMDEMVRITNKNGEIIYVNEALTKHSGYRKGELIGKTNRLFKSGKHDSTFYEKMYNTIRNKKPFRATFVNTKKDGTDYYEEQTITPILDEDNDKIKYFVSTSRDITEQVKMQEKLNMLATKDTLTGINNRYSINKEIDNEIRRVKRYGGSFYLMMIDIDFFKKVNDTYGHDMGDYVLKKFSSIVSDSIRDTDIFGRWGGEEFMLIAPNQDIKGAMVLAEKIRKNVENFKFKKVKHITISIGVTVYNGSANKEELIKKVDNSLYKAKTNGRNRTIFQKI